MRKKIYLILTICLVVYGVGAEIAEWKQTFETAEKAFYSGNPSECIPLFEGLTKELTEQRKTRALTSEEGSLLEQSLDYLAQSYFNRNDLTNAKASLLKLLQINPGYQMNEDLVSVKVVNLFNEIKKEMLCGITVTTTPTDAEVFLDGRLLGKSNLQSSTVAGEHTIEIKKQGYISEKKQVTIAPQQTASVEINLQEDPEALAEISLGQGDLSAAARYLEQTITLHEKTGDKRSMARASTNLGKILIELRRTDEAKQSYNEALILYRELNDPAASARVLSNLGELAMQEKRFPDATAQFEEARSLFEKAGDQQNRQLMDGKITQIRGQWKGEAVALLREGFQLMNSSQYDKAEQKYSQALEAARASKDKSSQLGALLTLGFLIFQRKDIPAAQVAWEEALTLARETGEKENEALALYDLSTIYYTLRDYPRAEEYYRQSEQLYRSLNMQPRKRPWESKQ